MRIEPLEQRTLLNVGAALPDHLGTLGQGSLAQQHVGGVGQAVAMQFHHVLVRTPALAAASRAASAGPLLPGASGMAPLSSASPVGLTPQQVRTAYGINSITVGSIVGDGAGQTIAIIDVYDAPNLLSTTDPNYLNSDLHKFNVAFGLPDPPSFLKLDQNGGTKFPAASGASGWSLESSLDVEWAHAIAPQANIVLIEADGPYDADLVSTAVNTARNLPGVSAISMSFGRDEFGGDASLNSVFTTPSGHTGVSFLASTGDSGSPGAFPAYSPNVVAVGGTTLSLSGNNYLGETGWSGSGGGQSSQQIQPSYQNGVQSSGWRQIPDVAFDADPASGVAVYDSYDYSSSSPWVQIGGTSVSAPCWAGLIAIANQLRVAQGMSPMDGLSETLPNLYAMPAANYHDITSGSNGGFSARVGYDLVTGLGSPVANKLVAAFVPSQPAGTVHFSAHSYEIGTAAAITVADTNATSAQVTVVSSAGDSEVLTLTARGSGIFQGSIVTSGATVTPGNGVLETAAGGTITVAYNDADDGTGQPLVATDQATTFNHLQITTASPLPAANWSAPYSVTLTATGGMGGYTWSTPSVNTYTESNPGTGWLGGGTAKGWRADDSSWKLTLPWAFPFYGTNYSSVWVCSNGFLDFTSNAAAYDNSDAALESAVRIAPLWQDLVTNGTGDNIFVTSNANYVAVRWAARTYADSFPVSFEAVLYPNGNIKFNYGAAQAGLVPTIGISKGDNVHYTLSSRDGASSIAANVSSLFAQSGVLPAGLALSTAGVISGTPTAAVGGYDFPVTVVDAASPPHSDTRSFHLDVLNLQGGPLDHFQWDPIDPLQVKNAPFPTTLTAKDALGYTVRNFNGTASLKGLAPGATAPTLVISELNIGTSDWIEMTNVASSAVNVSGWKVYVYDATTWPGPRPVWAFPAGTTIPVGGVFRLHKKGTSPGSYPDFYTGWNISWVGSTNPEAVLVANGSGQSVDFVCASSATPGSITSPNTILADQWQGSPIATNSDETKSYYRIGNQDHNNASDWTVGSKSAGRLNPGMSIPFIPATTVVNVLPTTASFVNGMWTGNVTIPQTVNNVALRIDDGAGHIADSNAFNVVAGAAVLGRLIFYNNSAWDGNNPAANPADDGAIATDKQALRGGPATFVNYTSYDRGINGIMVDVVGLPGAGLSATASAATSDFEFRVGNDGDPSHWQSSFAATNAAPLPTSVTVRPGAGVNGSDRVTLIWADGAIQNKWLQVRIPANARTGLLKDDVFYFGNAIADCGNNSANAIVDDADVLAVQAHKTGFSLARITDPYDFNRDRLVSATDVLIAQDQKSNLSPLQLVTLPAAGGSMRSTTSSRTFAAPRGAASTSASIPVPTGTARANAPAVDVVLAEVGRVQSALGKVAWDQVDWLSELELLSVSRPRPKNHGSAENSIVVPVTIEWQLC